VRVQQFGKQSGVYNYAVNYFRGIMRTRFCSADYILCGPGNYKIRKINGLSFLRATYARQQAAFYLLTFKKSYGKQADYLQKKHTATTPDI
jgi:hypothetical protein